MSEEVPCKLCSDKSIQVSVYPCGHVFCVNCAAKFCKVSSACPLCVEPNDIMFPVENIKSLICAALEPHD